MEKSKLGIITIGQSPRTDLTYDMLEILREDIEVIESGVLDRYTLDEVKEKFKPVEGEPRLVSRMRDGTQVILNEDKIIEELQNSIYELENKVDVILLLCTGKFPKFISKKSLIEPKPLLKSVVDALRNEKKIGIVVPDYSQAKDIKKWWKSQGVDSEVLVFSPYLKSNGLNELLFKDENIEYVIMDCMGYSEKMKFDLIKRTGKKVILPRTFLARVINEIMA